MASFQHDYKKNDTANISKIYTAWNGSFTRYNMVIGLDYYEGDNTTIRNVKRLYYSDGRIVEKINVATGQKEEARVGVGFKNNPYVANNRIGYGFFHDVVSQKVNTLLDEPPILEGDNAKAIPPEFIKNFGYALKTAGIKASAQGRGYIFVSPNGSLQVFDSEDCVPFFDDESGQLRALYRFWKIKDMFKQEYIYAEEYNEDGIFRYRKNGDTMEFIKKEYYYSRILSDIEGEREEAINFGLVPIVILDNNDKALSDLKPTTRAKIDSIDIVNSGFANNIDDFSDAYWTIKGGSGEIDTEQFEDFIASINRTKKIIAQGEGADAEPHQFEIPTTARKTFVDDRKRELIEETGVIDTASMTGSSLTTTAIQAATMKLRQRVSDFEWQVYQAAKQIIAIYCDYNELPFDGIEIEFTQLLIQNNTEILDNAVKIRNDISEESYMKLLQRAGYIDDADKEMERKQEQSRAAYKIEDPDDGLDLESILKGVQTPAAEGGQNGQS